MGVGLSRIDCCPVIQPCPFLVQPGTGSSERQLFSPQTLAPCFEITSRGIGTASAVASSFNDPFNYFSFKTKKDNFSFFFHFIFSRSFFCIVFKLIVVVVAGVTV